jgi:hypothetical protein
VRATVARADEYAEHPTEDAYRAYADAATASYPFGAGEGCHRVPELGAECCPGSGCRSGAGSLHQIALVVGADVVVAAIDAELAPWVRSTETRANPLP